VVTHPFHPLTGRRLAVLYTRRRAGCLVFVCDDGTGEWVELPLGSTDRGPAAASQRLSIEGLAALRDLVDALTSRCHDASPGGMVEDGDPEHGRVPEEAGRHERDTTPDRDGDGAGEHGGLDGGGPR
jgi:hypothetical protein